MRRIAIKHLGLVAYGNDEEEAITHMADMLVSILRIAPIASVLRLERAGLTVDRSTPSNVVIDNE